MTVGELNSLATYNEERARGVVHTPEWQEKMAALQREFDTGGYAIAVMERSSK